MRQQPTVKEARVLVTLIRRGKPVPCAAGSAERHLLALDGEIRRLRRLARRLVEHQLVAEHVGPSANWIPHWHALERAIGMTPRCRRCGCTDEKACAGGCAWAAVGLCTKCEALPG